MSGGDNSIGTHYLNSCQILQFTESPVALELRM